MDELNMNLYVQHLKNSYSIHILLKNSNFFYGRDCYNIINISIKFFQNCEAYIWADLKTRIISGSDKFSRDQNLMKFFRG